MLSKQEVRDILDIALYAGQIMLENGAETYRVEETIEHICKSRGLDDVHSFTIPTGIFMSYHYDGQDFSYVRKMRANIIDLHIISMVNEFSRDFVAGNIPVESALAHLKTIRKAPHYPQLLQHAAGGLASGFFTLIYGGNTLEGVLSFMVGFMVVFTVNAISKRTRAFFLKNLGGGIVNTLAAMLLTSIAVSLGHPVNVDVIVIGALMPLVPGVAITNALRDTISGDFVSGVSKLSEAFGVALAIALGVAAVLQASLILTGGVL